MFGMIDGIQRGRGKSDRTAPAKNRVSPATAESGDAAPSSTPSRSNDMGLPIAAPDTESSAQLPARNLKPPVSAVPGQQHSSGAADLPKPNWGKRHKVPLIVGGVIVALAAGVSALLLTDTGRNITVLTTQESSTTPPPSPVRGISPLTGLAVSPSVAAQPVVAVVIENHPDARPQSGLGSAGVVYEANAEGGITRFLALFLDTIPATIGPVRSLRTYFLDWGLEFHAPVAHAGGNADALDLVAPLHLKDLNALTSAASGFYRTTDRVAPHNLYTSDAKLKGLLTRFGYTGAADFTPSPRKADTPPSAAPHPKIHIDYSYSGYQVDYAYDAAANDYARSMAGAAHIDPATGKQIHVKNVVVQMMPTTYGKTRMGEETVIMQTVGQGKGWVLRDGDAIAITWKKTDRASRTQLLDSTGKEVALNAGNTWYAVVPEGKNVSF